MCHWLCLNARLNESRDLAVRARIVSVVFPFHDANGFDKRNGRARNWHHSVIHTANK